MDIKGSVAIVTGGNRGIGEGFVEELLEQGAARVYVGARNPAAVEEMAVWPDDRLVAVELDVTKPDQIAAAAEQCQDVTIVVNNAGAFQMQTLMGAPDLSDARQEMETNYFGMLAMCRAFAPVIEKNGGGAIANVLSAGAIVAVPGMGGYSPSKFAGRAASTCLRAELAPRGIHVAALIVGSVDTRMAAHVDREKSQPRDIGKAGLLAIKHHIDEHDTDPHAIEVRAFLGRDPHTLARSMAAPFNREDQAQEGPR
ncbi:SDR family oxidoreductase [Parasphingopyxis algicola]|uniref:SDR family oxidoreductase n=1 Tax=Parasphingopyxis algicola TaxID=2026624 RepID=UPI0015A3450D|nr:SDR family oxidoreductase [Parasphingopyxis algicola]QLC23998.1 SDR family oxidoreductase [Parasphingopyxis algicola]